MASEAIISERDEDRRQAVADAVRDYDLAGSSAWSGLDELSTHTSIDEIEVDPDGIIIRGNRFSGVANVYLTLQFGRNNDEGFHEAESFLGHFEGSFEGEDAVVEEPTGSNPRPSDAAGCFLNASPLHAP
jgi:hypothetical protein